MWTEVRRFTSLFQWWGVGNFPGHLKTAEPRICRHSDHRGKKWRTWLAPWWQVAFRRKKMPPPLPLFLYWFLFYSPIHLSLSSVFSPPGCFGMHSDVSQGGGGGWFVTWTDTWYCRTMWELVKLFKIRFFRGGCPPQRSCCAFCVCVLGGGGGTGIWH